MISLIICSRNKQISASLVDNLEKTVGLPFETISVDNSTNQYSIFQAYNIGASKAQYECLCFMHEDILFHTVGWGRIVTEELNDPHSGVIGVAGAIYKSEIESSWWMSNEEDFSFYHRYNLLQHFKSGIKKLEAKGGEKATDSASVVVLDGVWMCCRKQFWESHPFDEKTYNGFHFYDLDFSLTAFVNGFTNKVTYRVLLEHFSAGQMDRNWIIDSKRFHRKWEKMLPASTQPVLAGESEKINKGIIRNYLQTLHGNQQLAVGNWLKYWWKGFAMAPFNRDHFTLAWAYVKSKLKSIG
jgi:Glycosyltransferase like family